MKSRTLLGAALATLTSGVLALSIQAPSYSALGPVAPDGDGSVEQEVGDNAVGAAD